MEALAGEGSELVHRLAHGGEGRADVARGHDVVPTDDGDIGGHGDAVVLEVGEDGESEFVVGADERVRVGARPRGMPSAKAVPSDSCSPIRTGSGTSRP